MAKSTEATRLTVKIDLPAGASHLAYAAALEQLAQTLRAEARRGNAPAAGQRGEANTTVGLNDLPTKIEWLVQS